MPLFGIHDSKEEKASSRFGEGCSAAHYLSVEIKPWIGMGIVLLLLCRAGVMLQYAELIVLGIRVKC